LVLVVRVAPLRVKLAVKVGRLFSAKLRFLVAVVVGLLLVSLVLLVVAVLQVALALVVRVLPHAVITVALVALTTTLAVVVGLTRSGQMARLQTLVPLVVTVLPLASQDRL
jgi:hypothetical protein